MSNWEIVKINDIGKVVTGKTPRTDDSQNYGSDFMFLGPTDLHKHFIITESEKMISSKGLASIKGSKLDGLSILVGCIGWDMGNVALVNCKCATNQQINSITEIKESYNPLYIYYWLKHKKNYLFQIANVTRTPILNKSDFSNIELSVPNKIEQDKIAKVLSDLDSKIEINNKINAELEAMAKTLYDYWFVQFDFPDANGKPYKTSGGKMVWNEELKRDIPVGWEVKTLLDIANFVNGLACQKFRPKENEDSYRVIKIREMGTGFTENSEFVSTNIPDKVIIHNGNILFSWSATLDVKIWTGGTGALNQHIFKITSNDFPKSYYYFELLNYLQHFKMQAELRKTTMGHITQDHLKQSRITIPSFDLINKLDKIIRPILDKKVKLEEENQELASLRDWLLPMLMNGQVSVGDVAVLRQAQDDMLGMVAEPIEIYQKTEKKIVEKVKKVKIIPIKLNPVDVYKRTLLAAEIVFQLKDTYTLGHLKLQKMLYLCQEIENMALPMKFLKQAMGPYDNQLARSLDKQFIEKKWFMYQKNESLKYKPLENCGKHRNDFNKYFEEQVEGINYLIKKFSKFTSNQIEAVATLYACWKEAIDNNELINDKLIISSFYKWSKEKEKFKEENLVKALDWMRKNGVEPKNQID